MPDIEVDRLICIVTGVQLKAELGDRPLAYRIEQRIREQLLRLFGPTPQHGLPPLAPAVISDVYYLNSDEVQQRPTISVGGPGVNALSAALVNELPTVVAVENELVIQMDLDLEDLRCAVWGMDHLTTVQAVELFISKGYLDTFIEGIVKQMEEGSE